MVVLGITRRDRALFIGEYRFTVYVPAPFRTVETYLYGATGGSTRSPPFGDGSPR